MKLRSDNAILKANQIELEKSIEKQTQLLEKQKIDFEAILESNKKLNVLINTLKKDMDELDKRFNKGKRDVGKLALEKTKVRERK
jgi:chromosome segregation ATPase